MQLKSMLRITEQDKIKNGVKMNANWKLGRKNDKKVDLDVRNRKNNETLTQRSLDIGNTI